MTVMRIILEVLIIASVLIYCELMALLQLLNCDIMSVSISESEMFVIGVTIQEIHAVARRSHCHNNNNNNKQHLYSATRVL